MRKFAESYERSTDPQRTGAARERKTQAERERDKREEEERRRKWSEALTWEVWYPEVRPPSRESMELGWWMGQDRDSWPWFPFGGAGVGLRGMGQGQAPWALTGGPWRPSVEWLITNRYSPLVLERRPGTKEKAGMWREAFEDLLVEEKGRDEKLDTMKTERQSGAVVPAVKDGMVHGRLRETSEDWLVRMISKGLVHVGREEDQEQGVWSWGPWHGHFHGSHSGWGLQPWGWDQGHGCRRRSLKQLQAEEDKDDEDDAYDTTAEKQADAVVEAVATVADEAAEAFKEAETELEMYEQFLNRNAVTGSAGTSLEQSQQWVKEKQGEYETQLRQPQAEEQLQVEKKPAATDDHETVSRPVLIGTSTTTERRVASDGTVTTKTVVRRRFADGSEDREETTNTTRVHLPQMQGAQGSQSGSLEGRKEWVAEEVEVGRVGGRGENGELKEGEKDDGKGKDKEKKSWFWSGS